MRCGWCTRGVRARYIRSRRVVQGYMETSTCARSHRQRALSVIGCAFFCGAIKPSFGLLVTRFLSPAELVPLYIMVVSVHVIGYCTIISQSQAAIDRVDVERDHCCFVAAGARAERQLSTVATDARFESLLPQSTSHRVPRRPVVVDTMDGYLELRHYGAEPRCVRGYEIRALVVDVGVPACFTASFAV